MMGTKAQVHGFVVDTMGNGDKFAEAGSVIFEVSGQYESSK